MKYNKKELPIPKMFWGSVISAGGSILGGILNKKNKDTQATSTVEKTQDNQELGVNSSIPGYRTKNNEGTKSKNFGLTNESVTDLVTGVGSQLSQLEFGNKDFVPLQQARNADRIVDATATAMNVIPGWGTVAGAVLSVGNKVGGAFYKMPNFAKDFKNTIDKNVAGAFMDDYTKSSTLANAKAATKGLGLAGKATFYKNSKKYFETAKKNQSAIADIATVNKEAKENMLASTDMFALNSQKALSGNNWHTRSGGIAFAKDGIRLNKETYIRSTKDNSFENKTLTVPEFKKVGKPLVIIKESLKSKISSVNFKNNIEELPAEIETSTGVQLHKNGGTVKNVIVDGKLHAHKHDIKNLEEFKDAEITNKGVPVITFIEDEIVQTAEVEGGEIIFTLEVTKKLEDLSKLGTDEAAIEAGKLLIKEILRNTKDKMGIIKSID